MSIFGAEVIGTALLILLGDGVVAAVLLSQSKAQNSGWIVITFGWAMAVMVGVFAVAQFSGAHLNPAVTVGFAIAGTIEWDQVPEYFAGEFVGAFIGATLVWIAYINHWRPTEDPGLKLAVFCTAPAIRNTAANIGTEIIGTFVLVFGVLAFFANKGTAADPLAGLLVALLVLGHRPVARRTDGLRDQPGARPRSADHARDPPDPRQGIVRLGVRLDPGRGAAHRRRPRRAGVQPVLPRLIAQRIPEPSNRRRASVAKYAAAIDQGTTSTRCMIFDHGGQVVSVAQKEHEQIYPKPGWVEHDANEIWANTQEVVAEALESAGASTGDIAGVGITNQRETALVWDKTHGRADPQRPRVAGHADRQARRRVLA